MYKARLTNTTNTITTFAGTAQSLKHIDNYAIQVNVTDNTPSADTFTADAGTDNITITAHGYVTGLKGQASSTTTLPAGLSGSTDYYVIVVDANTIQLATSLANAQAGTQIDVTDAGTGTHTFTATALSGSVKLQSSNDNSNWVDVANTSTNYTASGSIMFDVADPGYKYVRPSFTHTAGQADIETIITGRDDRSK